VIGDLAMNRTTLPILYPKASRVITCSAVVAWSIFLPIYWHAGFVAASALISAGTFISWRFWSLRTADDDRLSYLYYNVSTSESICDRMLTLEIALAYCHNHAACECAMGQRAECVKPPRGLQRRLERRLPQAIGMRRPRRTCSNQMIGCTSTYY
jgi:hypothetical protein